MASSATAYGAICARQVPFLCGVLPKQLRKTELQVVSLHLFGRHAERLPF
jgi:hypothetical protein